MYVFNSRRLINMNELQSAGAKSLLKEEACEQSVILRGKEKIGPRPITFPLCLLQNENNSSNIEIGNSIDESILEDILGEKGIEDDLKIITFVQGTDENSLEKIDRKKVRSSSSYENIYDTADLSVTQSDEQLSTEKLQSIIGAPFDTKTQLPPEMCSSFENIYMDGKKQDEINRNLNESFSNNSDKNSITESCSNDTDKNNIEINKDEGAQGFLDQSSNEHNILIQEEELERKEPSNELPLSSSLPAKKGKMTSSKLTDEAQSLTIQEDANSITSTSSKTKDEPAVQNHKQNSKSKSKGNKHKKGRVIKER